MNKVCEELMIQDQDDLSLIPLPECFLVSGMPVLYWFSRRMTLWGTISFNLAVFVNLIIAFFYPYNSGKGTTVNTAVLLILTELLL